jgi:tetratricopeptide (TPR) repeat protein
MSLKKILLIGIFLVILSISNGYAFLFNDQEKIQSKDYIKNYLYASILHQQKQHNLAALNFNKIDRLEGKHSDYDIKFINSLIVNGQFDQAVKQVLKTEDKYENILLFDFIKVIHFIKAKDYDVALDLLRSLNINDLLFTELKSSLEFWILLEKADEFQKIQLIKNINSRYPTISLINQFLASNYINYANLYNIYNKKILSSDNYIRYQILSSWNEIRNNNKKKAKQILKNLLTKDKKNILLKQSYLNFEKEDFRIINFYNFSSIEDNISEIFYLFSNLYQQRDDLEFAEILLSISLDFNNKFLSNNLLRFENMIFYSNAYNFDNRILYRIKNIGSEYEWLVNYRIAVNKNDLDNIKNLEKKIISDDIFKSDKYLDLANYYRIKKQFKKALEFYEKVEIESSDKIDWSFFYFKGICYERLNLWKSAEKSFKKSLSLSPRQYSVINYLAYSWLEREQNISEAKAMLEDAVKLSRWELGYIIDSLGWAYYLQGDYDKAEDLLRLAYEKTSSESEVYDHYGDVLWKQKKYLQARYVWQNALNLENIDEKRKDTIERKILNGLND